MILDSPTRLEVGRVAGVGGQGRAPPSPADGLSPLRGRPAALGAKYYVVSYYVIL